MRTFLVAAAVGLLSLPASAQAAFGLRLGLNAATISDIEEVDDDDLEKQARLGVVAGVMADVPLTAQLSFHPELLYSQKGYKLAISIDDPNASIDGSLTAKVDYLEVPLLLHYAIPVGQNGLVVGIEAGPTLAYKLNVGVGCSGDFDDLGECDAFEVEDNTVRDFDIGVAGGVTVGAGPFGVGLRFTQGVTTIDDSEGAGDDDFSPRHQVFSVTGHYSFGR